MGEIKPTYKEQRFGVIQVYLLVRYRDTAKNLGPGTGELVALLPFSSSKTGPWSSIIVSATGVNNEGEKRGRALTLPFQRPRRRRASAMAMRYFSSRQ
jgi:hypothetical protein